MDNEESRKPSFIRFIRYYFYLRRDKENELETIANIRGGVNSRGQISGF
jgi:hypothetical protein